jgi:glycine/D-amino acid oxidase-like deaminating enzyme
MNLTSDLPFWTVQNGLMRVYPPLEKNIHCDALVIGGGISGALLADQLSRRGVDCVVIDRRDIGQGSTSASTALLQYEIDTPLHLLREKVGSRAAERAYLLGVDSINRLQRLAGKDCGFRLRPSIQLAARKAHLAGLRKEYEERHRLGLPVTLLDSAGLRASGIVGPGALRSAIAAEVDPYLLTHCLLDRARRRGARIFDRTTALHYRHGKSNVVVTTDRKARVSCRAVFFATGYETQEILPKNIVQCKSTYAMISEPLDSMEWWKDRAIIWSTGDPYLYLRTTADNRVLVGGEDDSVLDPVRRDKQIGAKTARLVGRFHSHFPKIRLETAFAWAGVFGSTKDGLGYIGPHPAFPRAYFALGFGGNGITYSEIASRILPDLFFGKRNEDAGIFPFDR